MEKNKWLLGVLLSLFAAGFTACDGGGGESFFGAAYTRIDAEPNQVDVGDSTFVTIKVDDFNDRSFFLKVRYPAGLRLLDRSSFIRVAGEDVRRRPNKNFRYSGDGKTYLVYFISKDEIAGKDETRVTFKLVGMERVSKGDIEVDADIDDPSIDNFLEIDEQNPKFDSESKTEVQVR